MSIDQSRKSEVKNANSDSSEVVDGELLESSNDEEELTLLEKQNRKQLSLTTSEARSSEIKNQKFLLQYIVLPLIFLTVSLLGGLRLSADGEFLFIKPPLVCLIFAVILLALFFRANLIRLHGWFAEDFSTTKNIANAGVLLTLFSASTQIFNSLLPEKGLPFWVVGFCFFWTLWNNLFAEFDVRRLIQSLFGMFGLMFVVKYLLLANLTAPANKSWIQGVFENPAQEAFTWLLDLPRFAPATGYVQFFALLFYLVGLFLLKPQSNEN